MSPSSFLSRVLKRASFVSSSSMSSSSRKTLSKLVTKLSSRRQDITPFSCPAPALSLLKRIWNSSLGSSLVVMFAFSKSASSFSALLWTARFVSVPTQVSNALMTLSSWLRSSLNFDVALLEPSIFMIDRFLDHSFMCLKRSLMYVSSSFSWVRMEEWQLSGEKRERTGCKRLTVRKICNRATVRPCERVSDHARHANMRAKRARKRVRVTAGDLPQGIYHQLQPFVLRAREFASRHCKRYQLQELTRRST